MRKVSLLLNLAIIILEIIGLTIALTTTGKLAIQYYTEQSNILALLASFATLFFLLTKRKPTKWLLWLKYTATLGLAITFLVTIFILGPMFEFRYDYLLFHGSLMFFHTLCPIIGIITFIFADNLGKITMKDTLLSLVWTVGYAIVMIILNILHVLSGPYPFLRVTEQPIYVSILWTIILFSVTFFVSTIMRWGKNRIKTSRN
ncbi:hypothetical protein IKE84_01110 [Candidatus Saccharibacteria bacterium]|nr:hypothetical protein [Candidatus Saccharibacteria bacterium]